MNIAITIGLLSPNESMWVNGIKQNALFLMKTIQAVCPNDRVFLANTTAVALEQVVWDTRLFPVVSLSEVLDDVDLLIVLGGAISQKQTDRVKLHGGKIVGYKCGSEYVVSMEAVLFNKSVGGQPYYNRGFDALWIIPQVAKLSLPYFQTLHRTKAQVVPFLWDPFLIESSVEELPNKGLYQARQAAKRISIMEPNGDVVKYFAYPLLIAEEAYRTVVGRQRIEFVSVTNTERLRENSEFLGMVSHCDLVRDRKAFFENHFQTAWFLSHHTDIVVSHQWENPLNYFYFDVLWLGYPLVHNADMIRHLGYYYSGFDIQAGKEQLLQVLAHHDEVGDEYLEENRVQLRQFMSTEQTNLDEYRLLIDRVLKP